MASGALDGRIIGQVEEAEYGLEDLERYLRPAVKDMHKREVNREKAVKAMKRSLTYLDKYGNITGLKSSREFKLLSEDVQKQLLWIDGLVTEMQKLEARLATAKKQAEFKVEDKYAALFRSSREVFMMISSPPRGTTQLIKELQKGVAPDSPEGRLLPILPMSLILWAYWQIIKDGIKTKP